LNSKICIIGCGWLGLPLAKYFIEKGADVNGSTSTKSKIKTLKLAGVNPFLLQLSSEKIVGNIDACLDHCKILILNIPPGLRKNPAQDYLGMMQLLVPHIENSSIENLLFISTTSVYEDTVETPILDETSKTSSSTVASKLLIVEQLFKNNSKFRTTILRFSGLIGENRHPAKYLSGKTGVKNPEAPINLIHQKDCIQIIASIINHNAWEELFNASSPSHPSRVNYYKQVCRDLNLPLPQFDYSKTSVGKIISSEKLARELDYRFINNINN